MRSARFSLTEDDRWVLVRALDDYADDAAERSADYADQQRTDEAEYYHSESTAASRLLTRLAPGAGYGQSRGDAE